MNVARLLEKITENDKNFWSIVGVGAAWFICLIIWCALLVTIVCYKSPHKIEVPIGIYIGIVGLIIAIAKFTLNGFCGSAREVQRDRQILLFSGCSIAVVSTAFCSVYQYKAISCESAPPGTFHCRSPSFAANST